MDDDDQGCTLVAQSTSGLYSEAGDGDQRGIDDGDHGDMMAAQRTSGQCGKVGDGDRGGMGDATSTDGAGDAVGAYFTGSIKEGTGGIHSGDQGETVVAKGTKAHTARWATLIKAARLSRRARAAHTARSATVIKAAWTRVVSVCGCRRF